MRALVLLLFCSQALAQFAAPSGVGDFTGIAPPGAGSGYPFTTSRWDFMLPADVTTTSPIAWRIRQPGYNHGMPMQDLADVIGGCQVLESLMGGLHCYSFSLKGDSRRETAVVAVGDTTSGLLSAAPLWWGCRKKDLSNTADQTSRLSDSENCLKITNGNDVVLLVKGNGDLVHPSAGDPVTFPTAVGITFHPDYNRCDWTRIGRTVVTCVLIATSASATGAFVLYNALPTVATKYVPVTVWATNLAPGFNSPPMGYTLPGTRNVVLVKMACAPTVCQHTEMAQDVRPNSQFMVSVSY